MGSPLCSNVCEGVDGTWSDLFLLVLLCAGDWQGDAQGFFQIKLFYRFLILTSQIL